MHYSNLWHLLILFSLSLSSVSALPVPRTQESLSSSEIQHDGPVYTPRLGSPCITIYATSPSSASCVDPALDYATLSRRSPAKPHAKLSAEAQKERKDRVRTQMKNRQDYNHRSHERQEARMTEAQRQARKERFEAHKVKLKEKAVVKQKEANDRQKSRKQAGREKIASVVAKYKATTNLPHRADTYSVTERISGKGNAGKTQDVLYTGAHVRTAVFNHHLLSEHPSSKPKAFENRLQGPPGNKQTPIPAMHGTGTEFPISSSRGGYHGGDKSATRVILQSTHSGHALMGVVAHDATRAANAPGHNDHFLVTPKEHISDWKEHLGEGIVFHV